MNSIPEFIQQVVNARVSMRRLEDYFATPNVKGLDANCTLNANDSQFDEEVSIKGLTIGWNHIAQKETKSEELSSSLMTKFNQFKNKIISIINPSSSGIEYESISIDESTHSPIVSPSIEMVDMNHKSQPIMKLVLENSDASIPSNALTVIVGPTGKFSLYLNQLTSNILM